MRFLRTVVLAAALSVPLASCASLNRFIEQATQVEVSPTAVYVAVNTFNAMQITATNYLRLRRCDGSTPVCRSPAATAVIIPAVRSGRIARNNLRAFMERNPGKLGAQGSYDALQSSISTLRGVFQTYRIGQ